MKTFTATSGLLTNFGKIVGALIPVVFGLAVLAFFWGVAKYVLQAGNPKVREQGRHLMIWGVIAIFIMSSIWGIVALLGSTLGITTGITPNGSGSNTYGSNGSSGSNTYGSNTYGSNTYSGNTYGSGTSGSTGTGGSGDTGGDIILIPTKPVMGSATATGPNSITFIWNEPSDGGAPIIKYTVQMRVSGTANWTTIGATGVTQINVTGLQSGTSYDFRVSATNEAGTSDYANQGTYTTTG